MLVEDDVAIAEPLVRGLERHGFDVSHTVRGTTALARVDDVDLVLLDLGLPDIDGTEVCRRIRAGGDTPVIVLSARDEEFDRVLLLEIGADDYLVKPFGLRELVARIGAVRRRLSTSGGAAPVATAAQLGTLRLDHRTHSVSVNGRAVDLSPREFDLLSFLASDAGALRTRADIVMGVWGTPHVSVKALDVLVRSLRLKLGDPRWVHSVRGIGFRLDVPEAEDAV